MAAVEFCERYGLDEDALEALESLPLPGQAFVLRTFCAPSHDPSGAPRLDNSQLFAYGFG